MSGGATTAPSSWSRPQESSPTSTSTSSPSSSSNSTSSSGGGIFGAAKGIAQTVSCISLSNWTNQKSSSELTPRFSLSLGFVSLHQALHVAQLAIDGEDRSKFGIGGVGQLGGMIAPQVDPFESLREMLKSGAYAKVSSPSSSLSPSRRLDSWPVREGWV